VKQTPFMWKAPTTSSFGATLATPKARPSRSPKDDGSCRNKDYIPAISHQESLRKPGVSRSTGMRVRGATIRALPCILKDAAWRRIGKGRLYSAARARKCSLHYNEFGGLLTMIVQEFIRVGAGSCACVWHRAEGYPARSNYDPKARKYNRSTPDYLTPALRGPDHHRFPGTPRPAALGIRHETRIGVGGFR